MDEQSTPGMVTCEKCGQTFGSQEDLDRHMQEAHPDEGMGGGTESGGGMEGGTSMEGS